MGGSISAYVHGSAAATANQAAQNGHNAAPTRWSNNNRRLRNRIRRGRRAGHAGSSGLFSIDAESGLQKVENHFRYPPLNNAGPYLGGTFLLGVEKYDRPTLASPLSDPTYAFGENYDLNFLAGKSNTVSLPSTIQELSEPFVPLRALLNIRRDSLRLTKCKLPSDNHAPTSLCYNLEFVFDSLVQCCITVYYICQESFNDAEGMRFIPHPQSAKFASPQYTHTAGAAQLFCHPDHVLDTTQMKIFSTFADKPKQTAASTGRNNANSVGAKRSNSNSTSAVTTDVESGEMDHEGATGVEMAETSGSCIDTTHYLPMVVHCVALEEGSDGNYVGRQSHATFLFLERANDSSNEFVLKYIKQKIWIGGASFLLQEVFGIENKHAAGLPTTASSASIARGLSAATAGDDGSDGVNDGDETDDEADEDEEESGNDCAICMSEPRDTMILPCRHLCICSQCAESLRYQANNCPICRAPFKYMAIPVRDGHNYRENEFFVRPTVQLRAYLRQTALEQQQQAELIAQQNEQDEQLRQNGHKSTDRPTPGNDIVTVAVTTVPNSVAVVSERQLSIVPGDSDADDEVVAVDLGKKKSRDRIEPPGFAGLAPCALIDTLNGTKQAYETLRNEAANQLKQRQQLHSEHVADRNRAVRVNPADANVVVVTGRGTRANTKQCVETPYNPNDASAEYTDFNSETDDGEDADVAPAHDVVGVHAVENDAESSGKTISAADRNADVATDAAAENSNGFRTEKVVDNAGVVSRRSGIAAEGQPKLDDYGSSTDNDDSVENRAEQAPDQTTRQLGTARNPRSSVTGTGGAAVSRSGSGHSNEVLLSDGTNPNKPPRKY